MPLNQLAIIVITVCFYFLFSWGIAEFKIRIKGYKFEEYDKLNYTIKFNAVVSFVAVIIACVMYFIGWVR